MKNWNKNATVLFVVLALTFFTAGCRKKGAPSEQPPKESATPRETTQELATRSSVDQPEAKVPKSKPTPTEAEVKRAIKRECSKRFPRWNTVIEIHEIGKYDEKSKFCRIRAYVAVTVPGTLMSLPVKYVKLRLDQTGIWSAEFVETDDEEETLGGTTPFVGKKDSLMIPSRFLGKWAEEDKNGKVVNVFTITTDSIEWTRTGEEKQVVTKFAVEDNGEGIAFDSKVTYSRAIFTGQVYRGDVKVNMKIKDNTLLVEIGGMKVQEEPGITVTRPPEKHRYKRVISQQ